MKVHLKAFFFLNHKVCHTYEGAYYFFPPWACIDFCYTKEIPFWILLSLYSSTVTVTRGPGDLGKTIRSQRTSHRDMSRERMNHGASLCTQFASWCADYLLRPITLILINEHTTHNLSEKGEKMQHVLGGCSVPVPDLKAPSSNCWAGSSLGAAMEATFVQLRWHWDLVQTTSVKYMCEVPAVLALGKQCGQPRVKSGHSLPRRAGRGGLIIHW